jgi:hypothetical protein
MVNEVECIRHHAELSQQLAAKKRRCQEIRGKKLWFGTKLLYFQNAESCRRVAQRLIGWRLGMVIIYTASVLVSALFWEVAVGFNIAVLAAGVLAMAGLIALHYVPPDASLETERRTAASELGRLASESIAQGSALKQLRSQAREIASQLKGLRAQRERAERERALRVANQPPVQAARPVPAQAAMSAAAEREIRKLLRRENLQASVRAWGCLLFIALPFLLFFLCSGLLGAL